MSVAADIKCSKSLGQTVTQLILAVPTTMQLVKRHIIHHFHLFNRLNHGPKGITVKSYYK